MGDGGVEGRNLRIDVLPRYSTAFTPLPDLFNPISRTNSATYHHLPLLPPVPVMPPTKFFVSVYKARGIPSCLISYDDKDEDGDTKTVNRGVRSVPDDTKGGLYHVDEAKTGMTLVGIMPLLPGIADFAADPDHWTAIKADLESFGTQMPKAVKNSEAHSRLIALGFEALNNPSEIEEWNDKSYVAFALEVLLDHCAISVPQTIVPASPYDLHRLISCLIDCEKILCSRPIKSQGLTNSTPFKASR